MATHSSVLAWRIPGMGRGGGLVGCRLWGRTESDMIEVTQQQQHTHLNAELQRIAKRDKKAFLSEQCKEIEENNRMGKTRDLKKIRDTKETYQAKWAQ